MNEALLNRVADTLGELGVAIDVYDLADRMSLDVGLMQRALNELCAQGRAAVTKKGRYATPEQLDLIVARASATRSGIPMAQPLSDAPALKIRSKRHVGTLPGDLILTRPVAEGVCEIVQLLSRGKTQLAAFIRVEEQEIRAPKGRKRGRREKSLHRRIVSAIPCDRRIPYLIQLADDAQAVNDSLALVAIDRYPDATDTMAGHILRVLGEKSDMLARLRVIAEEHGFPTQFPSEIDEAAFQQDEPADAAREDLRDMTVFTIDGPFSKDFDDAVSLERLEGGWRLGVHIADVSHYVRPGTPVDREAFRRGTSLYLPGLTVPMLPEILSNHLCSLRPGEDRRTLSLFMTVQEGRVADHHLCRAVIRSCARLTYDQVNRLFEGEDSGIPEALHPILEDMRTLSQQLRRRRAASGAIDFDMPEPEFVLNEENVPTDILTQPRGEAERLIEDFMLAANETIANLARNTALPLVYRVHEEPDADKLHSLEQFLAGLNVQARIGMKPHPGELQTLLERTKDHPSADAIRRTMLRSLPRARYCEQPLGHYALSLRDYCHFTSPIRRYPDLIVHRMMKALLDGGEHPSQTIMGEIARQSSQREQESVLAEREADDLMKARYMQDRLGETAVGVVTGVTSWGMYVTLDNTVEGLVHIATLDDYYEFDPVRSRLIAAGSGTVFRLGDRVRVRVDSVNLARAEVNFMLLPWRAHSE